MSFVSQENEGCLESTYNDENELKFWFWRTVIY